MIRFVALYTPDYLFHNKDNEYKNICMEIENLIKGEEGYRIYVTGHR